MSLNRRSLKLECMSMADSGEKKRELQSNLYGVTAGKKMWKLVKNNIVNGFSSFLFYLFLIFVFRLYYLISLNYYYYCLKFSPKFKFFIMYVFSLIFIVFLLYVDYLCISLILIIFYILLFFVFLTVLFIFIYLLCINL